MILTTLAPLESGNGRVIVAHPGTQHSYETARGVLEAGLLRWYLTGFYHSPNSGWNRLLRLLPDRIRSRVKRELSRRYKEGLEPEWVKMHPAAELLYVAVSRLGFCQRYTPDVLRWRNEWFDWVVGRVVAHERPAAVICYDSCALQTFKKAQKLGILCILDQSIAHLRTGLALLREEAELHPDFADSFAVETPNWLLERCSEEVATADHVLAGSAYVMESLIENGVDPSRVTVMPYGADTQRFRPLVRPHDGAFRLLFVGQVSQRKGIQYLLEAVQQLNLPGIDLMLVGGVVGTGKGLAAYQDHFTHVPQVSHHEVHTYFQRGDVFVYPSLHEGSALAVYEALASGLPVITTPNSGTVVRDGVEGFIVPIRDVEALKEKILLLYTNQELREEMGRNARKRATEFTWQAYRQRLGTLLHQLLTGRGVHGVHTPPPFLSPLVCPSANEIHSL